MRVRAPRNLNLSYLLSKRRWTNRKISSSGAIALRVQLIGSRTVPINVERIMAIDLEGITRRETLLASGSVLPAATSPEAAADTAVLADTITVAMEVNGA